MSEAENKKVSLDDLDAAYERWAEGDSLAENGGTADEDTGDENQGVASQEGVQAQDGQREADESQVSDDLSGHETHSEAQAKSETGDGSAEAQPDETPPQQVAEPDEPDDNAERSRLGRRVRYVEDSLKTISSNIEKLLKSGNRPVAPDADVDMDRDEEVSVSTDDGDTPIFTKSQLREFLSQEEKRKESIKNQYSENYKKAFVHVGMDLEEAEYDEIINYMDANRLHVVRSGNPLMDAQSNFRDAQVAILKSKLKSKNPAPPQKPSNPFDKNKGNQVRTPGGPSTEVSNPPSVPSIKLDKYAAEFVKSTGMSNERVAKVLAGDINPGLTKRGRAFDPRAVSK